MTIRSIIVATILTSIASISAPLAAAQFGDYQPKGFLSDYSRLEPEGETGKAFVYRNTDVEKGKYKKVMVDRIKVFVAENADYKGVDPAELKELVDYFHNAIVSALGGNYPVVTEPGPDVVRLRIAVTDLVPNKPEASVVTLVVPFVWLGEAGAGVAQDEPGSTPFLGEATIEIEALDSMNNEQIGAFIEERVGKKYHWTKGVTTAAKDYLKAYSTWAYTRQAMDNWAQMIKERLDAHNATEPVNR